MSPAKVRRCAVSITALVALGCAAGAVRAADQPAVSTRLLMPDSALVRAAIEQHPDTVTARAQLAGNAAQRDRLRSGEYETLIDAGELVRRGAGFGNTPDWTVSVSRPIRLPQKAQIDARTGERIVARGTLYLNDVRHELARTLLARWFEALRQTSAVDILHEQADLIGRTVDTVDKRVRAGDASRLEKLQVEAALATARAQLSTAMQRAAAASVALQRSFPELDVAAIRSSAQAASDPLPPTGTAADWQQLIVSINHEIALRRAEVSVRQAQAQRATADRIPDPTVGVRAYSDAGGRDRVLGAFVSIPFPGEVRRHAASMAYAATDEALARASSTERRVLAEALTAYTAADEGYRAWKANRDARAGAENAARLAMRAFELGEGTLSDTLLARRIALDAVLAETAARLDAIEAHARLLVDAHRLWDFDEGAEGVAVPFTQEVTVWNPFLYDDLRRPPAISH